MSTSRPGPAQNARAFGYQQRTHAGRGESTGAISFGCLLSTAATEDQVRSQTCLVSENGRLLTGCDLGETPRHEEAQRSGALLTSVAFLADTVGLPELAQAGTGRLGVPVL